MFNKKNPMRYFSGSTFARLPLYKLAAGGTAVVLTVSIGLGAFAASVGPLSAPEPSPTPIVTATPETAATPTPSPTPSPTPTPSAGSYILPDSAARRLTQADVANLTWEQCCLARNEIFARHGRIFQTPQIAAYFEAQSWYHGTVPGAAFDNNSLSPTERANADFLANYENATWGHSYY